ncbi:MAG: hypothetical protein JWO94_1838 [Verrucomicrobiaceae bacterium]|nr:hypothetical protein [Verrucomicrobiaceae bacterium]
MNQRLCLCVLLSGELFTVHAADKISESARYIDRAVMRDYERQADRERLLGGHPEPRPLPSTADDATFLRRACVDLAGRLPRVAEVRAFMSDPSPNKRARLADALLKEPGAAEVRFRMLAEAFRVTDEVGGESQASFIAWLRKAAADDMPFNEMVKAMIMGDEGTAEAAFLKRDQGKPMHTAVSMADAVLGDDLYCASCHDHPFSNRTQREVYEFAACFGKMKFPPHYMYINGKPGKKVKAIPLPEQGNPWVPQIMAPVLSKDARLQLADAIAGSGSKRLARTAALRVWRGLFGMPGLENDQTTDGENAWPAWSEMMPKDFEASGTSCFNAPHRPSWLGNDFAGDHYAEAVHALAEVFEHCGFKLGELQRILTRTEAYGREGYELGALGGYTYLLPAPQVRRLPSEVIWDALVWRMPSGQRDWQPSAASAQVPDESHPLRLLGRGRREWPDESTTPVSFELTRFMMNSAVMNQTVSGSAVVVDVDELVLSILGRMPTAQEKAAAMRRVRESPASAGQDIAWALLNTSEFLFER